MVDVFEEVEEQLRSQRYLTIARKGWPYAAGVIVVAAVATFAVWGWRAHQLDQSTRASDAYEQAFEAASHGDWAIADRGFGEVARSGPKGYQALALMQQAGLRTRDNKTAEAVSLFDQAAKVAPDAMIGDAARLKAAYLLLDTASMAEIEARLQPLTQTGHPYVTLAREALAMKRLASGNTAEARQALAVLPLAADATESLQARAQIAMAVLDSGQAAAIAPAAKAAASVTPAQLEAAKAAQLAAQAAAAAAAAKAQPPNAPQGQAPAPAQAGAAQ